MEASQVQAQRTENKQILTARSLMDLTTAVEGVLIVGTMIQVLNIGIALLLSQHSDVLIASSHSVHFASITLVHPAHHT
jgi:hypothetical protein